MPINRLPPVDEHEDDRVLCATLAFAAACDRSPHVGGGYAVACAAFRRAVRARLVREVAEGLPADVVGAVMLVAIRFAVAGRASGPAAARVERTAAALLARTVRALRPDGADDTA